MKLAKIGNKLLMKLKKNAPHILVGVGVVGTVTGTVLACKATKELDPIIEEHNKEKEYVLNNSVEEKKELTKVYIRTGAKIAKTYAPSAAVIVGSLSCVVGSHAIMTKRNVALGAAYATLETCFKQYRKNVVEKFGEDTDQEMRYGIKLEKKDKNESPDVPRKAKFKEEKHIEGYSDYARFFDENCLNWVKNAEYNLIFLKSIESCANEKLKRNGYLFLNDVYKALGLPESKAGQVVGWIYDSDNPIGDNCVDFKLYDINSPAKREFVNGIEPRILLDFNVDGNIWERM